MTGDEVFCKVGGLVGASGGKVTTSYATGDVVAKDSSHLGGLVGYLIENGRITASYATGHVTAEGETSEAGGLVGYSKGTVKASYATGRVTVKKGGENWYSSWDNVWHQFHAWAGGLVGANGGVVVASYSTGSVMGKKGGEDFDPFVGGLIGELSDEDGTIEASYYDSTVATITNGTNTTGAQPTAALQGTISFMDIYADWAENSGVWHLGTADAYPLLRVDFDGDGRSSVEEFGTQPRTGGGTGGNPDDGGTPPEPDPEPEPDPYDVDGDGLIEVANLEALNAIRYDLGGAGTPIGSLEGYYMESFGQSSPPSGRYAGYELATDLDFSGSRWSEDGSVSGGWRPIGDKSTPFTAIFEGNNRAISNLYINKPTESLVAFFGKLSEGGVVRHLNLLNVEVIGDDNVGSLVGSNHSGTLVGCHATGSVTATDNRDGDSDAGGLVGWNGGTLMACSAAVLVTATAEDMPDIRVFSHAGGLVGINNGTLAGCHATGTVTAAGRLSDAGGLAGENRKDGTISGCYATGDSTGVNDSGGLVGSNIWGTINSCYATGTAMSTRALGSAGGLAAYNNGTINSCYATGTAEGTETGISVGGLVGYNDRVINNCYATGKVTEAAGSSVGIVPGVLIGARWGTTRNSYFNYETSGRSFIDDHAQSTAALQGPMGYTGIYEDWNTDVDDGLRMGIDNGMAAGDPEADDPWDFGTSTQYPALRVDFDGDGTATVGEFGPQSRTGGGTGGNSDDGGNTGGGPDDGSNTGGTPDDGGDTGGTPDDGSNAGGNSDDGGNTGDNPDKSDNAGGNSDDGGNTGDNPDKSDNAGGNPDDDSEPQTFEFSNRGGAKGFVFSPNPVRDRLRIIHSALGAYPATIYTLAGRVVSQKVLASRAVWEVSALPPGVYVLQLEFPERSIYRRLVKE